MTGMAGPGVRSVHRPHWLPLPCPIGPGESQEVDEADAFSKAEVVQYYPRQGFGFVRTKRSEELFFHVAEADLVGTKRDWKKLKPGMIVGYDVARTSRGLRIKRMKIY